MGKRKRAQVSYLDQDDGLDELLGMHDHNDGESTTESNDDIDDVTYGKRKPKRSARLAKKAKLPKKPKNQKPFRFLDLPAELRDQIYELALVDPHGISLLSKTKAYRRTVTRGHIIGEDDRGYWYGRSRRGYRPAIQNEENGTDREPMPTLIPALLAVNKQIYAEAVGYLYQQRFVIEDTYALHDFVAGLGSHRTQLDNVTIRGWGRGRGAHKSMNFTGFTLLASCTNLKSITLDCNIGGWRNPKGLARQIYRDGVYFFEGFGLANGAKDAGVNVLNLGDENFSKGNRGWWGRNQNIIPDYEEEDYQELFKEELRKLLMKH
ncbi:hypothetical protein LTR86_004674 [Recurvomyces mirabilis]|nr:hypothetical protein LTR86_004674 [Recurvomyces mirabilis]